MRKHNLLPSIILLSSSLFSCSPFGTKTIKMINNLDYSTTSFINISATTLKAKIDNKNSFVLFLGNEYCSLCEECKTSIRNEANDIGLEIYNYNYDPEISFSIFNNVKETPSLLLINKGNYINHLSFEDILNVRRLSSFFSEYINGSSIYSLSKVNTLTNYLTNHQNSLVFTYLGSDKYIYSYYYSLYDNASIYNKDTLFIDLNLCEERNDILSTLTVNEYDTEYLLIEYKDSKIKTINEYISDTDGFNELIANYYC